MVNGIRTSEPRGLYKGRGSKFCVGSQVRQTLEEDRRTYNNNDEDNSPKTLSDKKILSSISIHITSTEYYMNIIINFN